jgi:hypothetical protein
LEEQVRVIISRDNLSQSSEGLVKDMLAHTVPGVMVIASLHLQAEGGYTHIKV